MLGAKEGRADGGNPELSVDPAWQLERPFYTYSRKELEEVVYENVRPLNVCNAQIGDTVGIPYLRRDLNAREPSKPLRIPIHKQNLIAVAQFKWLDACVHIGPRRTTGTNQAWRLPSAGSPTVRAGLFILFTLSSTTESRASAAFTTGAI
ncbi:hypothetical protein AC579_5682 [Pseudocercospora musae]|uniref:Uncharacterized protein n=1 Tax=Pseudocercospora musae TaxID=113226 RepID=A0A139HCK8_9PEZI|nr:hypothetical protein AC579_5682 [Pseudocercospora musae]